MCLPIFSNLPIYIKPRLLCLRFFFQSLRVHARTFGEGDAVPDGQEQQRNAPGGDEQDLHGLPGEIRRVQG